VAGRIIINRVVYSVTQQVHIGVHQWPNIVRLVSEVGCNESVPGRCVVQSICHNIKMDLRGLGWGDMEWIDLAQNRYQWRALENTVMNIRVPCNTGHFLSSWETCGFTRTQLPGVH
jgi:hypothetical protein